MQSAIGYGMWTRRLYRDYPVFFAYILNQLVIFFVLVYCYQLGIRDVHRQAALLWSAVSSAVTA